MYLVLAKGFARPYSLSRVSFMKRFCAIMEACMRTADEIVLLYDKYVSSLAYADISGLEFRFCLMVLKSTIGQNHEWWEVSYTYLKYALHTSRPNAASAAKSLAEKRILICNSVGDMNKYKLNSSTHQWTAIDADVVETEPVQRKRPTVKSLSILTADQQDIKEYVHSKLKEVLMVNVQNEDTRLKRLLECNPNINFYSFADDYLTFLLEQPKRAPKDYIRAFSNIIQTQEWLVAKHTLHNGGTLNG